MLSRRAPMTAVATDDDCYFEDWFVDRFLDLANGRMNAAAAGRPFDVMGGPARLPLSAGHASCQCRERALEVLELEPDRSLIVTEFDGKQPGGHRLAARDSVGGRARLRARTLRDFSVAGELGTAPEPRR